MTVYQDNWTKVYVTDALSGAKTLEPGSVHTIVTSPPYWGLRSYLPPEHPDKHRELGTEASPEEYVEKLAEIFGALRLVLRDDGTLWLNIGSVYAGSWGNQGRKEGRGTQRPINGPMPQNLEPYPDRKSNTGSWVNQHSHFKPKDLIPLPWMVGLALQKGGWWLRADCIWSKPNPMPSSVRDRPTISHEYVLMFSKKPRYFFDQEAVRQPNVSTEQLEHTRRYAKVYENHTTGAAANGQPGNVNNVGIHARAQRAGRNIRSVWTIATRPYPRSHYATFPPDLIYPCIKAGCCEGGTVLDPFMGSGTTAWAARKLGRQSIGFDLDERNIGLIAERMGLQEAML